MESEGKYSVKVILKTMELLKCFSPKHPEWTANELSKKLSMNRTTVFRILNTLAVEGFVQLNPKSGGFRLGPTLIGLSMALFNSLDIRKVANNLLRELALEAEESVHLTIWYNDEVMLLEQWESPSEIKVSVPLGRRFPAYATCTGKLFLAGLPEKELKRYLAEHEIKPLTPKTVTNQEVLQEQLIKIRQQQIAFDFEEYAIDLVACGVPVYSSDQNIYAAIAVMGTSRRMQDKLSEIAEMAKKAGIHLSNQLGYLGNLS